MQFTKMQGVGNDFVVIDFSRIAPDTYLPELSRKVCTRRFGIGADGMLLLSRNTFRSGFGMRMFNPDGSEDMCGNGLRCSGLWALREGWISTDHPTTVLTREGDRQLWIRSTDTHKMSGTLSVTMGTPRWDSAFIPYLPTQSGVVDVTLSIAGSDVKLIAVNTGSCHAVLINPTTPADEEFYSISRLLEVDDHFPERTSVMWAYPIGPNKFGVRIWERGAGETLGCGTGACAIGVVALLKGLSHHDSPVEVVSKGGILQVDWPGGHEPIVLTGPAAIVYRGDLPIV